MCDADSRVSHSMLRDGSEVLLRRIACWLLRLWLPALTPLLEPFLGAPSWPPVVWTAEH